MLRMGLSLLFRLYRFRCRLPLLGLWPRVYQVCLVELANAESQVADSRVGHGLLGCFEEPCLFEG